jgi:DNA-binding beta-propeller fold protein YncE
MKRSRLVMILLALSANALAQGSSNGGHGALNWMLNIPDWLQMLLHLGDPPPPMNYVPGEIAWTVKCEGGFIVLYGQYTTYPGVHGFDPNVGRNPTAIPCDPMESTDPNGNPAANANSVAEPKFDTQSPAQGSNPPPLHGGGAQKIANPAARRAATVPAPGALNLTLPYRELGIVPFSSVQSVNPSVTCASGTNPSAFVVDHINGTVSRFNPCTAQTITTINVTSRPLQVRVTPDGSQAIVTSYDNAITFIDTATNQITNVLQPNILASGLAISSDGSYALVTNYDNVAPYLAVVDIASQSITGTIPLDRQYPQSVFLNPDNTLAWVTYPWVNAVEVIDILTGTVTRNLSVTVPYDVAFNPTGTTAYVASGFGTVEVFDTGTYQDTASIPAASGACDLQVSPDGHSSVVSIN